MITHITYIQTFHHLPPSPPLVTDKLREVLLLELVITWYVNICMTKK